MVSKKEIERLWLDEIAKIDSDFPPGAVIEGENPDFVIKKAGKTIGIELADFYRGQGPDGSIKKKNESLQQKVITRAQEQFERTHGIPLIVDIVFQPRQDVSGNDLLDLATEIARIVSCNIPNELYGMVRVGYEQFDSSLLDQYLSSITINRADRLDRWHVFGADWTDALPGDLNYVILTHDQNVERYLKNCDEVWLYIVADSLNLSSSITSTEILEQQAYQSQFRTIRFYNRASGKVIKLH